jgi:putative ABC transport system permease protein
MLIGDLLAVASLGMRTRRLRALLSELGIGIGVAAVVGVLGIASASQADLLTKIGQLSNLLEVTPGQTFGGGTSKLPTGAPAMIGRITDVQGVTATARLSGPTVRRTDREPSAVTRGISVTSARTDLLSILGCSVNQGAWLNAATERYPAVVLGAVAAQRLGVDQVGQRLWIGNRWFAVVGILDPFPSQPDLDQAAFIGFDAAATLFQYDGSPTTIYVRTDPDSVDRVQNVLGTTTFPQHPEEVQVSRPSDALAARAAAKTAFATLFLGLGAVALLVGGVAIANTMLTAVMERRSEVGLRRSLGATKVDIGLQFLTESMLLSGLGGLAGVLLGAMVTLVYVELQGLPFSLPPAAVAGGLGAALVTGAAAGLYPALRAARLAPTEALGSV